MTLATTTTTRRPAACAASAAPVASASPSASRSPSSSFDWRDQWYPVAYLEDLIDGGGVPVRVSLFDEPIALALKAKSDEGKRSGGSKNADGVELEVIALADRCSHRGAALSEGRVTSAGCLQCPYHGYTFDAEGSCVAIPHAPGAARRAAAEERAKDRPSPSSSRTSVRSYASAISQGIIWLSPSSQGMAPPPESSIPTIPELDLPGWVSDDFVRDFDGVDAQLLIANVADPDHGLFAHQTPNFDAFSASAGSPMRVSTREGRRRGGGGGSGGGLSRAIVGRVAATPVLTAGPSRPTPPPSSSPNPSPSSPPPSPATASSVAELVFEPPCHVRWARMNPVVEGSKKEGGRGEEAGEEAGEEGRGGEREGGAREEARFIASFYATPLGVGRTRLFIRYARSVSPWLRLPRPLLAMSLNGFLDSDTLTVASQALRVARAEAAAAHERERGSGGGDGDGRVKYDLSRSLYLFRSPTESFLSAVTSWLDEALPTAPGRDAESLSSFVSRLEADAADGRGGLPRREKVLDRFEGHTSIVPSSMRFYRNAKRVAGLARGLATVAAASAVAVAAVSGGLPPSLLPLLVSGGLSAIASLAASDLASRFEYRYTRERQARDLERISVLAPEVERATGRERF